MCDFVNMGQYTTTAWNVASGGLQIATQIGGAIASKRAADANNDAVQANYQAQLGQMQTQSRQVNQQAQQQRSKIAEQVQAEQERLATMAGESGVAGNTYNRLQHGVAQAGNDASTNIETNRANRIAQIGNQTEGLAAQANSQMKNEGINWGALGLQIATDAVDFGSKLDKRKK